MSPQGLTRKSDWLHNPLATALGRRFKVVLPYRGRKVSVTCRRCLTQWWFPRGFERSGEEAPFFRSHRCDPSDVTAAREVRRKWKLIA